MPPARLLGSPCSLLPAVLTVTLTSAENLAPLSDGHLWACGVSGVERLLGRQRGTAICTHRWEGCLAVDVWKGRRVTKRRHRQRATRPRTPTLQVSTRVRSVSFGKLWWERDAADDLDGWGSTARQPERHKERHRGGGSSHQKKKTLQRSESYILTFSPPRGNQGPRHKVLCPNFHNKLVTRTGQEPRAPGSTVLGPSPQSLPGHAAGRNSVLRDVKCFTAFFHQIPQYRRPPNDGWSI